MTTFVLVHGAWGGAHGFHLVRPRLHAAGHDVFTPALTGLGERSHLLSPQITLDTHIQDVENVLVYWDLRDIVLVGYSYGGMVVTGLVPRCADRISHLVYLDAFLPEDGQSLDDLAGNVRPAGLGAPWLAEPLARGGNQFDDPAEGEFALARVGPHPIGTLNQPVSLPQPLESYPFTRTYIKATQPTRAERESHFWRASDRTKASPDWRYLEIDTNHGIPVNRPDELVQSLLGLL